MFDDMTDQLLLGLDKRKEIFSLWTEVIYLRNIINMLIGQNGLEINKDQLETCKMAAHNEVLHKFPNAGLSFGESKPEEEKPNE